MIDEIKIRDAVLDKLGKRYTFIEEIGCGGFSYVYRLRHKLFGEDHALKILNSNYILEMLEKENKHSSTSTYNNILTRFLNEARFYNALNHHHIVKVFDVDIITLSQFSFPYLTMKYITGKSLKSFLLEKFPLDFSLVIGFSLDILDALSTIHKNSIIHRDIKPANVIIENGNNAILIDFGLAKDLLSNSKLTSTGYAIGTPSYMAPEQFSDSRNVGPWSDLYSLGIMMYELFTGELPFTGKTYIEIMDGHCKIPVPDMKTKGVVIPPELENIVKKALAKDREKRFPGAADMANELMKFKSTYR